MMLFELPTESDPVRIIEGDCLEVMRQLPDGCVDAVVTDPPYGLCLGINNDQKKVKTRYCTLAKPAYASYDDTYENFVGQIVPRINAAIAIAGRGAVFTGPHIQEQKKADAIGGIYSPAAAGRTCWGSKNFLPILLYGKHYKAGQHRPTVLRSTANAKPNGHPCPKPLEWMRWLIQLCSRPGEVILDPFGGSGTTAVAALREGRRCILIEKEPSYADIARRRVKEAMGTGLLAGVGA